MSSQATYLHGVAPNRSRLNPLSMVGSAWVHRDLIYRLARREIEARYKGSLLGLIWSFLVPLMMLGVYTFVFAGIFKMHWVIPPGGKAAPFFILVFAGMICLNLFVECIGRSPSLMLSNVSYIKKVVFPLDILPIVILFSELFTTLTSCMILAVAYVVFLGVPPLTALLLPIVFLPLPILILGLVWFISSLGVYLRDLRQLVAVLLGMIGFICPLFYPLSALTNPLPASLRWVVYLNPLTVVLEQVRQVLFWGQMPDWHLWAIYMISAWLVAWMGLVWFSQAQRGFADVV